jgi:hypothetical protein
LLVANIVDAAGTEQPCQAAKNEAGGRYADCRQKAEAALATSGDTAKYNTGGKQCSRVAAS